MPSEIAVPFRVDLNGRVVSTSNPDAQVRQHVLALINTTPEERLMVPGYGVNLVGLTFGGSDPEDVATQASLRIQDAMAVHEPGVELLSTTPEMNEDGNIAQVSVEYRRLDAPDSAAAANANTAIIGASGVVREVIRG